MIDVREHLRSVGLRATRARVEVLEELARHDAPRTHAEVAESLAEQGRDRATVYRNLVDLSNAGLVHRFDLGDHVWRYELCRNDDHDHDHAHDTEHPHFVCNDCGKVECLEDITVKFTGNVALLRDSQVQVQVRGVCGTCR